MKPGRELDALVAEKVMGWKRVGETLIPPMPPGSSVCVPAFPQYSTDAALIPYIVARMAKLGFDFTIGSRSPEPGFLSTFRNLKTDEHYKGVGENFSEATCLAALRAVGVEV